MKTNYPLILFQETIDDSIIFLLLTYLHFFPIMDSLVS